MAPKNNDDKTPPPRKNDDDKKANDGKPPPSKAGQGIPPPVKHGEGTPPPKKGVNDKTPPALGSSKVTPPSKKDDVLGSPTPRNEGDKTPRKSEGGSGKLGDDDDKSTSLSLQTSFVPTSTKQHQPQPSSGDGGDVSSRQANVAQQQRIMKQPIHRVQELTLDEIGWESAEGQEQGIHNQPDDISSNISTITSFYTSSGGSGNTFSSEPSSVAASVGHKPTRSRDLIEFDPNLDAIREMESHRAIEESETVGELIRNTYVALGRKSFTPDQREERDNDFLATMRSMFGFGEPFLHRSMTFFFAIDIDRNHEVFEELITMAQEEAIRVGLPANTPVKDLPSNNLLTAGSTITEVPTVEMMLVDADKRGNARFAQLTQQIVSLTNQVTNLTETVKSKEEERQAKEEEYRRKEEEYRRKEEEHRRKEAKLRDDMLLKSDRVRELEQKVLVARVEAESELESTLKYLKDHAKATDKALEEAEKNRAKDLIARAEESGKWNAKWMQSQSDLIATNKKLAVSIEDGESLKKSLAKMDKDIKSLRADKELKTKHHHDARSKYNAKKSKNLALVAEIVELKATILTLQQTFVLPGGYAILPCRELCNVLREDFCDAAGFKKPDFTTLQRNEELTANNLLMTNWTVAMRDPVIKNLPPDEKVDRIIQMAHQNMLGSNEDRATKYGQLLTNTDLTNRMKKVVFGNASQSKTRGGGNRQAHKVITDQGAYAIIIEAGAPPEESDVLTTFLPAVMDYRSLDARAREYEALHDELANLENGPDAL